MKSKGEGYVVNISDVQAKRSGPKIFFLDFLLLQAPGMKSKGEGYIVNISDVEAKHTGPAHPGYAASKWAMSGFSHACYEALRPHGIKVGTA